VYRKDGPEDGCTLSVLPGLDITEVSSGLHGPLDRTREGNRIKTGTPRIAPVDVIILR